MRGCPDPKFYGQIHPMRLAVWFCLFFWYVPPGSTLLFEGMSGAAVSYLAASRRWLFRPWLCGKGTPQYPGMGRALFIPYFAGLALPPLAFPAMAWRQGRTTVPRDGPGAVHPIFCWVGEPPLAFLLVWMRPGSSLAGAAPNYW